jgi:hypothetical protein
LLAALFFFPLRLAFALGRLRAVVFAFGRLAAFFGFFAARFGFGALIGSSSIDPGIGAGGGGGGNVGSTIPEPVQLLSEKSLDLSIRCLLAGCPWGWPIAYARNAVTQVSNASKQASDGGLWNAPAAPPGAPTS